MAGRDSRWTLVTQPPLRPPRLRGDESPLAESLSRIHSYIRGPLEPSTVLTRFEATLASSRTSEQRLTISVTTRRRSWWSRASRVRRHGHSEARPNRDDNRRLRACDACRLPRGREPRRRGNGEPQVSGRSPVGVWSIQRGKDQRAAGQRCPAALDLSLILWVFSGWGAGIRTPTT